jgi:hypothetical protein
MLILRVTPPSEHIAFAVHKFNGCECEGFTNYLDVDKRLIEFNQE